MTDAVTSPVSTASTGPARAAVDDWLARFGAALSAGDAAAAAELFGEVSYWRDLIALTWNIKTLEGRAEIAAMLIAAAPTVRPGGWKISEEPAEAGGVTEAWIEFETAAGRGRGLLRLRDGLAWTLLTTLYELKGHEEPSGRTRPKGAEHGAS